MIEPCPDGVPETTDQEPNNQVAEAGDFTPLLAPPVKDFVAALTLVGGGLGVALVPDSVRCVRMPGVVHRPLADVSLTTRLVGVHRREETSPAVRRVTSLPPVAYWTSLNASVS